MFGASFKDVHMSFLASLSQVSSLWTRVQVKSQVLVGGSSVRSEVLGHESKSSIKVLMVVMSFLISAAMQSTKNTANLYLNYFFNYRNSKHLLYYYHHSFLWNQSPVLFV